MTDKPSSARARQLRLLDAGMCTRCANPRTAESGHTLNFCASCAELDRARNRRKYRLRVGNALDVKVTKYKRGPRKLYDSPVKRSDVYDPSKFVSYKRKRKVAT